MTAYKTYVRPKLEYGTEVFSPHYKKLIKRLEKPQRTYTRKVLKLKKIPYDSYEHRLQICDLDSLEFRRALTDLRTTFKIHSGDFDLDAEILFDAPYRTSPRLHSRTLYKAQFLSISEHAFWNRVINTWNAFPSSFDSVSTVSAFTTFIHSLHPSCILPNPTFPYY
jgi:hypothetical protein